MRERPILFSAPMVRAILEGRKTQTRRVVKPQPTGEFLSFLERPIRSLSDPPVLRAWFQAGKGEQGSREITCPYGKPGDRLWVREAFALVPATAYRCSTGVQQTLNPGDPDKCAVYREGWERSKPGSWRPSIFMPRWASRITLEITDVRVERLQAISQEDALAEGIKRSQRAISPSECQSCFWDYIRNEPQYTDSRSSYSSLWESIHGPGSWDTNPWVWVVEFRRLPTPTPSES